MPRTSYLPNNGVLLADTRTGFLRLVRFRDIDPDKGHLLARNYLERQQELGLEVKGGNINIQGLKEKQMDEDLRLKLDTEADFLRRWRFFLERKEEKLDIYLEKSYERLKAEKRKVQEIQKERVLTPEKAVEREISLDFAQEQMPMPQPPEHDRGDDMGLHLGDDF